MDHVPAVSTHLCTVMCTECALLAPGLQGRGLYSQRGEKRLKEEKQGGLGGLPPV